MPKLLRIIMIVILSLPILWITISLALIFSPSPRFSNPASTQPNVATQSQAAITCESMNVRCFRARDGAVLRARWTKAGSNTTIILLHGVLSNSSELEGTAKMLHDSIGANIINLDLRGHGQSDGAPGDTSYIGQYEDDLADVVTLIRQEAPNGHIVLSGHSMGGGIVMRYAARRGMPAVDGYLLFAPHLGTQSPTTRSEPASQSASQSGSGDAFMQMHVRRTIGLIMLNALGIQMLNNQDTLYFNTPPQYLIHRYTFRAMAGMSPDDYRASLLADTLPLLIVAGKNDEAFLADQYPIVTSLHVNGEAAIVDGESHDSILRSEVAMKIIKRWFGARGLGHSMLNHVTQNYA